MQEIKVGETFEYKGKKVVCKSGHMTDCLKCVFLEKGECWLFSCNWKYACTPAARTDGRTVYFEEVNNG